MRVRRGPAGNTRLVTRDAAIAALADAAGVAHADERVMALEAVEGLFQRLASASLGQPGAMGGLPAGREAAAVVLILREFMHHCGFEVIAVVEDKPNH